ncbi:unnamed protein product [Rangifer tarandus platyrhynchus]|uniref:Uncharacterized protein n=1 Tax=Rangifer tarandus platyrhynchus TaxID=3082113 RepID=A0ABN8ZFT0_RANTA|nr:unnamed protein product [Rangifer tarandus platyrhynchus]CAI9689060.1 unnamed protein product [Rangifer tarandus platyrhynchus]
MLFPLRPGATDPERPAPPSRTAMVRPAPRLLPRPRELCKSPGVGELGANWCAPWDALQGTPKVHPGHLGSGLQPRVFGLPGGYANSTGVRTLPSWEEGCGVPPRGSARRTCGLLLPPGLGIPRREMGPPLRCPRTVLCTLVFFPPSSRRCGEGSEEVGPPRRCSRPAEERDSDGDACGSYSALRLLINCFLSDAQGRRALLVAFLAPPPPPPHAPSSKAAKLGTRAEVTLGSQVLVACGMWLLPKYIVSKWGPGSPLFEQMG